MTAGDHGLENFQEAWSVLRVLRHVLEELAPPGSVPNEEYLDNGTFAAEGDALLCGIRALADEAGANYRRGAMKRNGFGEPIVETAADCGQVDIDVDTIYAQIWGDRDAGFYAEIMDNEDGESRASTAVLPSADEVRTLLEAGFPGIEIQD